MSNPFDVNALAAAKAEVPLCPHCKRRLLAQASALCSWCGMKIDDPEYQAQAAQARLAQDEAERARVEAVLQEEAQFGVFGRLKRRGAQDKKAGALRPTPLKDILIATAQADAPAASPETGSKTDTRPKP